VVEKTRRNIFEDHGVRKRGNEIYFSSPRKVLMEKCLSDHVGRKLHAEVCVSSQEIRKDGDDVAM
jgi:hypothetical protein